MYWWEKAAALCEQNRVRRFGFITTNSLSQAFNRRLVLKHLRRGLRIIWAVPDHPWTDCETGAAVRIAMTCVTMETSGEARLISVAGYKGKSENDGAVELDFTTETGGAIRADLRMGADVAAATPLLANSAIAGMGVALHGAGFILTPEEAERLGYRPGSQTIRPYLGGRDLLQARRKRYIIDFSFMDERAAAAANPAAFQHVMDRVLPERRHNRRESIRNIWWRFGWERPVLRRALEDIGRYIATTETAKQRTFQFIGGDEVPDHKIVVIASDDAAILGVLSSRPHVVWSLAAGGRLGVGNDSVYNKTRCFDPFPFPAYTDDQQATRIRELGEALDTHRKRQQAAHPDLTMTGMYNVLEKLRSSELLNAAEKIIHDHGLLSILKKIHDDLNAAVFAVYGWPHDLTDEQILEKLVRLNAERTEEENSGSTRWLRPEFQNPSGRGTESQTAFTDAEEQEATQAATRVAWPKKMPEQIAAVRNLLLGNPFPWTAKHVAKQFKDAVLKDVETALESLTALGLFVVFKPNGETQWKPASPPSASERDSGKRAG